MRLKLLFLFIYFFIHSVSSAQVYIPIDTADSNLRTELSDSYKPVFERFNSSIKAQYSGKKRTEILNIFEEIQKDFIEEIEEGYFTFDERFQNVANSILEELKSKNPEIPRDLKILVSKHGTVNGYCMADGTLVINMGCFKFLENEDQVAGIVAHEIAHNTLEHITKSIDRSVELNHSDAQKGKIKSIKKRKIGRNEEAFELMRSIMYEEGSLRRNREKEADSLGFKFYTKTKYNDQEFLNAFKLMQRYDTIKPAGVLAETYQKYFDIPTQVFKDEWLKMEDFSAYDYEKFIEKINKDSIASHPEFVERIAYMQKIYPELENLGEPVPPDDKFKELENLAKMEEVPNLYFLKQYGLAIYFSLYYLQSGKDETFYKYWLGKNFEKIYEGRLSYKVNRYLDTVSPKDQSESYMQFLNFMWNLNVDEIKAIADFYSEVPNSSASPTGSD